MLFQFHPNGYAFASCSEDKTTRLFDIRSDQQLATYEAPNKSSGFTSCGMYSLIFEATSLIPLSYIK